MVSITQQAHEIVRAILEPGEIAIDGTAGNGHDTLFLAETLGNEGVIWSVDIQPQAIASVTERLAALPGHSVRAILGDHAELEKLLPAEHHGKVGAVMFNLGYLPGSDHQLTTRRDSTLAALNAAIRVLRGGGIVTVITYRGHPGSEEEASAVESWVEQLPLAEFQSTRFPQDSPPKGPHLLAIKKLNRRL